MSLCGILKPKVKGVTLEDMDGDIRNGATGGELLDWQKALLNQRLRDAEAHPEDWVSWDEARQRLERQFRREQEEREDAPAQDPDADPEA